MDITEFLKPTKKTLYQLVQSRALTVPYRYLNLLIYKNVNRTQLKRFI